MLQGKKHYYRIRLDDTCIHSIQRNYRPLNALLESAFIQTDVVDFRLNDIRSLDRSLREKFHLDGEPDLPKTHFFLMREANDDYAFSLKPPDNSRRLEGDVWKAYVGNDHSFDQIIAYHWKEVKASENIKSFAAFAKFKTYRSNFITILIFVIGVLIFGTFSGLVANWLFLHFTGVTLK